MCRKMISISEFRHVAIVVKDISRMIDFYTGLLGFDVKQKFEIESDGFRKGIAIPNAKAMGAR